MSFLSKHTIFSRCSICGREISPFEKRLYFNVPEAPKNNRLWICTECSKIKGKAVFPPDGSLKIKKPDGTLIDTATSSVNEVDVKSIRKSIITILIIALILLFVTWIIGVSFFGWNDNGDNYKSNQSSSSSNSYNNDDEYGFSDYLKEQDPDLYDSIKDRYDSVKDEYYN